MVSNQWRYPRGVIDPPGPVVLPGGPLQLFERGIWDPAEQYWGEPEDTIAASLAQVTAPAWSAGVPECCARCRARATVSVARSRPSSRRFRVSVPRWAG